MTGTSPAATTLTPESSEQPRETRYGLPLVERFDALRERAAERYGAVEMTVTDRLNGIEHTTQRGKVSSPELASLAAKYVNFELALGARLTDQENTQLWADVRSLAASVLAQAEGNHRK